MKFNSSGLTQNVKECQTDRRRRRRRILRDGKGNEYNIRRRDGLMKTLHEADSDDSDDSDDW
jgi:hypothetical protein